MLWKTHCIFITEINLFLARTKMKVIGSEDHTKHINTFHAPN